MFVQHNRLLALSGFGLLLLLGLFLGQQWVAHAQTDPPVHPDGWDLSFAGDGRLEVEPNCWYGGLVHVQADDKFIVSATCNGEGSLLRYLPDGILDLAFGVNGRIATGDDYYREADLVTTQADGKIVAAVGLRVTRFHGNGTLDTSFGVNGVADVFGVSDADNEFTGIGLQPDGKLIAVGVRNQQPLIARYTHDGHLDTTFQGQGYRVEVVTTAEQTWKRSNRWSDLTIQPDGKLVVGRTTLRLIDPLYEIYDSNAIVARFNADGALDTSFGSGGIVNCGAEADSIWFNELALQSDGKILVGLDPDDTETTLMRLLPSGANDPSFFSALKIDSYYNIQVDHTGRILMERDTLHRLLPDGNIDVSFGKNGTLSPPGRNISFAMQADGRILVSNNAYEGDKVQIFRYTDNRPPAPGTPPAATATVTPTATPTPTPTPTPLPPEQRALALVYAVLDNNLGSEWTRLVNNIEAGAHPGVDVRLLIDGPATGDAYVYTIQPDRNPYCPTIENPTCNGRYREGYNYQRFFTEDTARPHALYQFLVDSLNAYPQAPQISLTIIGHGSGWGANALPAQPSIWRDQNDTLGGMLWDDHTGVQAGSRSLSTLALGQAIHWATSETGRTLNLLYLDGCSMGMTEVAYELRNRADYLLASPNTDWATFAYDQLLPLVRYDRDGRALGEAWLAAEAALLRSRTGYPFTLALTDLRQITPLATTVTAFADALQRVVPTQRAAITRAYQQSDRFDSNYDAKLDSNDNYLDLRDFAAQVQSSGITDTLVISHAQAVQTLLSSVVITVAQQNGSPWLAEEQTWSWRNLGGLSIYAPLHQDEAKRRIYYNKENLAWAADSTWDEFITTFWDSDGAGNATAAILTSELPVCFATTQNCVGLANQLPVQPPQSVFLPIASKFGDQP